MNISPFTIYLWQLCDKIHTPTGAIGTLLSFAAVVLLIVYFVTKSAACEAHVDSVKHPNQKDSYLIKAAEEEKFALLLIIRWRWVSALAACTLAINILTPSSNTVAMMVIIPQIADSKVIQQDLPDLYNAAIKALKDNLTPPAKP